MQALNNNVFVKPIEEDKSNGLFIPPHFRRSVSKVRLGKVFSAGSNAPTKEGDIVVISIDSGEEIIYRGEELIRIKPNSILAIK